MPDMLVHLLSLPDETGLLERLKADGVQIRRALAPDKFLVVDWVREHSNPSAAGECDVCFAHTPVSCFVATRGADIVGYACYDAIAHGIIAIPRVALSARR